MSRAPRRSAQPAEVQGYFRLRKLGLLLVFWTACAHRPESAGASDRDQVLIAAARYTILRLADPDIVPGDRSTWTQRLFCLQVDDKPPPADVLRELSSDGFQVSADLTACGRSGPPSRVVSLAELVLMGGDATIRAGVIWGEGGTLRLTWTGTAWVVRGVANRWVS